MKKTNKKVTITTACHRGFEIDVHEIADDRAKYYAERDEDTTYEEEYQFLCEDNMEVTDWLFNNMDWYECSSLKEVEVEDLPLSDLRIEDYGVTDESW